MRKLFVALICIMFVSSVANLATVVKNQVQSQQQVQLNPAESNAYCITASSSATNTTTTAHLRSLVVQQTTTQLANISRVENGPTKINVVTKNADADKIVIDGLAMQNEKNANFQNSYSNAFQNFAGKEAVFMKNNARSPKTWTAQNIAISCLPNNNC